MGDTYDLLFKLRERCGRCAIDSPHPCTDCEAVALIEELGRWAHLMEFVDTREAARLLAISRRTLEKLRTTGGGPPYHKVR